MSDEKIPKEMVDRPPKSGMSRDVDILQGVHSLGSDLFQSVALVQCFRTIVLSLEI